MGKKGKIAALFLVCVLAVTACKGKGTDKYAYRTQGIEKLEGGDFEGAVRSFDEAIQNSNGLVRTFELDVLKYRGEAEYRLEDYEAAAHTYDILIQVDGEKAEYLYLRSISTAVQGQWEAAFKDYEQAKELDPAAELAVLAMAAVGAAMEDGGQTQQAMALYQNAIGDGIQSAQVYNRMGMCKLKDKDYGAAIDFFEQGLILGDETASPSLAYNRAVAYEYNGDFKQALTYMQEYEDTYGPDQNAQRELAFLKTR